MALRLVGLGLALDLWAMVTMQRQKANIMPHRAATALVITGPFGFSRNPIYLGNTLLIIGIGFLLANAWFFLAAGSAAFAVTKLAIEREEIHLAAQFGSQWTAYSAHVSRWLRLW